MRNIHRLFWAAVVTLLLPLGAAAQQPLQWQPTLGGAKRLAAQTDRLVLIHFWADWCRACQTMDRDVFSQPGVAAAVQSNYVPVKINADHFPATRNHYGVTTLPTNIIVTPQGRQIDRFQGPTTASEYAARLSQTAAAAKGRGAGTYARIPAGPDAATGGQAGPPRNSADYRRPGTATHLGDRNANHYTPDQQASATPTQPRHNNPPPVNGSALRRGQPQQPAAPPSHTQRRQPMAPSARAGPDVRPPSDNPPLGLDGYCPVQLNDNMNANVRKWTLGDRRWGAIHRGRTYLFAGSEQQRRFLADPDRYAPALSGNDVVAAVQQRQTVPGYREHGVIFGGKVYLFANEASLERFSKTPDHYANCVLQAMQARGSQRQQLR